MSAMHGKFKQPGTIEPDGTLQVSGPTGFESDEIGAVIQATVTQDGTIASGETTFIESDVESWSATLTAHSGTFNPGTADARGAATVSLVDGGIERYTWAMKIAVAPR